MAALETLRAGAGTDLVCPASGSGGPWAWFLPVGLSFFHLYKKHNFVF